MKKRRTASVIFGVILLCLFILLAFHMRQVKVVCVGDSITYGSGAGCLLYTSDAADEL